MTKHYHRAFGVYGIIGDLTGLVVIKKNGGPYINRFDLPGGSLDDGEPLDHAISREIHEETGLKTGKIQQLGTTSFRYPWHYQRWQYNQHICVFYHVEIQAGVLSSQVPQFVGQDSLGAVRVPLQQLTLENASPLVLWAKDYLLAPEKGDLSDRYFANWKVLKKPVFFN